MQALYFTAGKVLMTLFNLRVHFTERGKNRTSKGNMSSQNHSASIEYLLIIYSIQQIFTEH